MASMTRVKNLERLLGSGDCPCCSGGDPNEPFEVIVNDDTPDHSEPDRCEACGRLLNVVVRWEFGGEQSTAA